VLPFLPVAVFSVALFTVAVITVADFTVAVFTVYQRNIPRLQKHIKYTTPCAFNLHVYRQYETLLFLSRYKT